MALVVFWVFSRLGQWIDNVRDERTDEVVGQLQPQKFIELENKFRESGLRVWTHRQVKAAKMIGNWQARVP